MGPCFVTATLKAEGLSTSLGQFCEASECILVQQSTDWTISSMRAHPAEYGHL